MKCGTWSQWLWVESWAEACQENWGSRSLFAFVLLLCKEWAVYYPMMQLPLTELYSASLYTSKNSASAEWSCINLRYSRERHQHTGCVHRLWVWLFIVVSCFSCLSISCLWIATHSSQIQLMITFIQTQLLQGPFWYENPMTRRHALWNRRYGRYWNPGDKHFIWSCTFPCLLFLGSCHLPVLCSDTAQ